MEWIDETECTQQAMLRHHDTSLLFSNVKENQPKLSGEIYFYVEEVDELYAEIKDDVFVVCPPTDVDGTRIFKFRDCNGYNLVFATVENEIQAAPMNDDWGEFFKFGNSWFCDGDGNENFNQWSPNWN